MENDIFQSPGKITFHENVRTYETKCDRADSLFHEIMICRMKGCCLKKRKESKL